MKTDYDKTGKTYKKLDAYRAKERRLSNAGKCIAYTWVYFGTSTQFKTCKNFKAFLEQTHPGGIFKVKKQPAR